MLNEMLPQDEAQTNSFGNLNVYTWADFWFHYFIFSLSLSTRIMLEMAQCDGLACSHIRITAGLPTVQKQPVSTKILC